MTGDGASSEIVLILARVGQGLGAAMASATGLSILVAAFSEGNERNRALSIFSAATGSGFAAGMILGGIMTSTLGWRWVFDINVPIGVFVSLLSIKYISNSTGRTYKNKGHHLDIFGAITVTAGLMLLVYTLNSAQNIGIGSVQTLELLLISMIVLSAFIMVEYRSKAPLMPLQILRRSSVFGANTLILLQVAAFVAMIFILTNYLQRVLAYSALLAGLAFVPMGIIFLAVSGFLSARFVNRFGVKPILILGMTLQTVGYLILSVFPLADYFGGLLLPMVILGFGTGLGFTAINIAALTGTRRGEEGLASGLINTSRQIGGPIGLAVILTVANLQNPSLTHNLLPSAATFGTGLDYAFLAAAMFTGFGIIIANLLKQERHHLARVVQASDS